jgi:hypothetical protein
MNNTSTVCTAVHHIAPSTSTTSTGRIALPHSCSKISPRQITHDEPWTASIKMTSAFAHAAVERADEFSSFNAALRSRLPLEADPIFHKFNVLASPFVVTTEAFEELRRISRVIFGVAEKVVHMYIEGDESLGNHFAPYERLRPFMTKRSVTWQQYGRYDFLISDTGTPMFCELNTAMATGYLPMHRLNKIFHRDAPSFLKPSEAERALLPYDRDGSLGQAYRRMEVLANASHGAIAILIDENGKYHEADLIKADLESAGREVVIGSTQDIRRVGGNIFLGDTRISSTYNKFRLFGSDDHWSEQAFSKYWQFLETVRSGDIHLVNNFAAMTISEDKSFFGHAPSCGPGGSDRGRTPGCRAPHSEDLPAHSRAGRHRRRPRGHGVDGQVHEGRHHSQAPFRLPGQRSHERSGHGSRRVRQRGGRIVQHREIHCSATDRVDEDRYPRAHARCARRGTPDEPVGRNLFLRLGLPWHLPPGGARRHH